MSWFSKLYETYDLAQQRFSHLPLEERIPPIFHTPQNAHINIVIDGNGNFIRAEVLEKIQIFLPATEKSEARARGLEAHGLADKIQYVAADYALSGGGKESGFEKYSEQLKVWCESDFAVPAIKSVYAYISKGTLVADLVEYGIMHAENGMLITEWRAEAELPALFRVLPKQNGITEQGSALVCWTVEIPGVEESKTWESRSVQQSWIQFIRSQDGFNDLCYVKGVHGAIAFTHPAKIRHSGDKAKLISSNDGDGFTFRGRFIDSIQAATVSVEVTQKAHSALSWLIKRQGYRNDDQWFVSWAVSGKDLPNPFSDPWEVFENYNDYKLDHSQDFGQSYSNRINRYLRGTGTENGLERNESVCMIGIDSATPGRMAVIYYRETIAEEFIAKLEQWYNDLAWPQRCKISDGFDKSKKPTEKIVWKSMAPAPFKIVDAVYGAVVKSTGSLKKNLISRLLPCIVEGQFIPPDIVNSAFRRAVNRMAYSKDEIWLWEQNLGIACALFKGYSKRNPSERHKKEYDMALDESSTSRDYLFGRLLAVAEKIESYALYKAGEKRVTTAERLMQRFADRPYSTWRNLELALRPYIHRLQSSSPGFLKVQKDLLDKIHGAFDTEQFKTDNALSGEFLLGYHSQRLELNKKHTNEEKEGVEDEPAEEN